MDEHYRMVMEARERAGAGPKRLYFAYSTVLDRAAFEGWREQHGYAFFELPEGMVAEARTSIWSSTSRRGSGAGGLLGWPTPGAGACLAGCSR